MVQAQSWQAFGVIIRPKAGRLALDARNRTVTSSGQSFALWCLDQHRTARGDLFDQGTAWFHQHVEFGPSLEIPRLGDAFVFSIDRVSWSIKPS
jgi:hypothetical protein